jgi:uncharacterized protein YceK
LGVLVTGSFQGCGTIASHLPPPKGEPLPATAIGQYRGVQWDLKLLDTGVRMTDPGAENLETLFLPLYLADLPLSAVADTILLPFDKVHTSTTNAPQP